MGRVNSRAVESRRCSATAHAEKAVAWRSTANTQGARQKVSAVRRTEKPLASMLVAAYFHPMIVRLFLHWAVLVLGLYVVTLITPISYDRPSALLWAAVVLVLFNSLVKPILVFISLPLVLVTLGFFFFIINALLLYWVPDFVSGFHVPSFFWAFIGSLILSVITSLFTGYEKRVTVQRRVEVNSRRSDVIDI
jgi:putative membrane protein